MSISPTAGLPVNGLREFRALREHPIIANLGCTGNENSTFDCAPELGAKRRNIGDEERPSIFCSPSSGAGVICQSE